MTDTPPNHNTRKPVDREELRTGGVAADRLRSIVGRIERLDEERKALTADIKDIYSEAKSAGFDTKVLRKVVARRKLEREALEEIDTLTDVYESALN